MWWVPELGAKPRSSKKSKSKSKSQADATRVDSDSDSEQEKSEGEEDDDDWRKFFDEPVLSSSGTKPKPQARLHKLTVHQSLHTLVSHRAVFTRAWLALLPALGSSSREAVGIEETGEETKKLTVRALNVMHRGVMPHLTRAVLVMDWVGGCVDYGAFLCPYSCPR